MTNGGAPKQNVITFVLRYFGIMMTVFGLYLIHRSRLLTLLHRLLPNKPVLMSVATHDIQYIAPICFVLIE